MQSCFQRTRAQRGLAAICLTVTLYLTAAALNPNSNQLIIGRMPIPVENVAPSDDVCGNVLDYIGQSSPSASQQLSCDDFPEEEAGIYRPYYS